MYNQPFLTESDIRSFLQEAPRPSDFAKKAALFTVVGLLVIGIAYVALNLQSLLYVNSVGTMAAAPTVAPTPVPTAVPTATPAPTPIPPDIPENSLSYAALGIAAPITWDVPFDAKVQSKLLPTSTIQLAGTAHPGQNGVVAISGHSSNYPWIKGPYNSIFAPLVKAQVGQVIEINYQNKLYRYEVISNFTVKPTQVDVLADNSGAYLELITCTPIGTSLNRNVTKAKQIYPDPATNAAFTASGFSGQLPSGQ